MHKSLKVSWRVRDFVTFRPARARCGMCRHEWNVDLQRCDLDVYIVALERGLICPACRNQALNFITSDLHNLALVMDNSDWIAPEGSVRAVRSGFEAKVVSAHPLPQVTIEELLAELDYRGFLVFAAERIRSYAVQRLVSLAESQPAGLETKVTIVMPERQAGS